MSRFAKAFAVAGLVLFTIGLVVYGLWRIVKWSQEPDILQPQRPSRPQDPEQGS